MTASPTAVTDLVAIDLVGDSAAKAIRTCWDSGEAVFVVDPTLPDAAKSAQYWHVRPTARIDGDGRSAMDGVPITAEAAAVVMTSGTAAHPKGVVLTHRGRDAMALAYSAAIGVHDTDRWLAALPLSGVAGLAIVARSYVTGVPATIHDGYSSTAITQAARSPTPSIVSLVPTALQRLLDAGAPIDRFRVVIVGGAPLPDGLRRRAEAAGAHLVTSYGMTETWGGVVLDGRPIRHADVRIADDGQIEIAGPMVMYGYRLDREATHDALRDGWLATGDLGTWDGTRLTVTGRRSDRIVTGGVTVSPAAIERVLLLDPGIVDVGVTGTPDEEWGERVVAYVVPADPTAVPSLERLRSLVKEHLAAPNAPREVHPVLEIPRNAAGKVLRRRLG